MEPNPHYRYIRSLGRGASLFSVTEAGIDEFLEAPDAGNPGIVVLARDGEGDAPPEVRFLGGARVGDVMRRLHGEDPSALRAARPLAVVAIEAGQGEGWIGPAMAGRLRRLADAAREGRVPDDGPAGLGRWVSALDAAPEAIAHVIGLDPFEVRLGPN